MARDSGQRSVTGRDITNSTVITGDISFTLSHWPVSRLETLRIYLADQFEQDSHIRFKQTELDQAQLIDMYVDVPIKLNGPPESIKSPAGYEEKQLVDAFVADIALGEEKGAAECLMWPNLPTRLQIIAGPGRGKSTVLQYVCQSYRAAFLDNQEYLAKLPRQHRPKAERLPFRIDLRDLGKWLAGGNPFGEDRAAHPRSLEGFIAYSVSHFSGGREFSVTDFHEVVSRNPSLIALDALDEIASIELRRQVADEVDRGYARLQKGGFLNVRMVLTTRPSANPESPVLESYLNTTLGWLRPGLAHEYVTKWALQWKLTRQDTHELRAAFQRQNDKPHMRELQQSLMQLAILLYLLHAHGESLPDQRTLLYEDYIRVYFNREAAKTPLVRKNRKLLEDSLGHIAWELHSSAETDDNGGRATAWQLDEWLAIFLARTGNQDILNPAEIRDLLIDRLRILAGPIEGLFEFEVQPMREYFAAKHLNNTAPLRERQDYSGRSERFIALCERPYWGNVARFFAGLFHPGELLDLVEVFLGHVSRSKFGLTSVARAVFGSLVQDRTFSSRPTAEMRAAEFCLDVLGCRLMLGGGLTLELLGGAEPASVNPAFAAVLRRRIELYSESIEGVDAAKVLPQFAVDTDRAAWWLEQLSLGCDIAAWLRVGSVNESFGRLSPSELGALVKAAGVSGLTGKYLLLGGAAAMQGEPAAKCLVQAVKDRSIVHMPLDRGLPGRLAHHLAVMDSAVDGKDAQVELLESAHRLAGDCWASRYLAIRCAVKAVVRRDEKASTIAFKSGCSLTRRAGMLRQASRMSAQWWAEARRDIDEPLDLVTWIVAMASIAEDDVLGASLDLLAEALFDLPGEWARIACRDTQSARSRRVKNLGATVSGVGSLRGVVCILLLDRWLPAKTRIRALKLATGANSEEVMNAAAELGPWATEVLVSTLFDATEDPSYRARVVQALRPDEGLRLPSATDLNAEGEYPAEALDSDVLILRNAAQWPVRSVLEAEARVSRHHAPEPLRQVAMSRGWFVPTS